MTRFNLLPIERLNAVAQFQRIRRWAMGIGAGTTVLTAALFGGRLVWNDDRSELRSHVIQQENTHADLAIQALSLKEEVDQKREALHAANDIGDEPDWSILLALIANRLQEHVVLTRIALEPASHERLSETGVASQSKQAPSGPTVLLDGVGTSAHQVSLFSVRLEDLGLFERVVIERSARSTTGQLGSIVFTIRCRLQVEAL